MGLKKLSAVLLSLLIINLAACGSGGDHATPPTAEIGSPDAINIPDNTANADYQIIIYGNSHSSQLGSLLEALISGQLPNTTVDTMTIRGRFLDEIVAQTGSVDKLKERDWTHAIFQGQKYSQSGAKTYPTDATERLIAAAKAQNVMPILFPEHPQRGNPDEGQQVYELHLSISAKQASCVAPIGLVWNRLLEIMPNAVLHQSDGNHASYAGNVLTAMTFYEVISGELADTLAYNPALTLTEQEQALFAQVVTEVLALHPACPSE